ncbi:MAG: aconitate hydratase AcnA [Nitrososphaeria archaeon]
MSYSSETFKQILRVQGMEYEIYPVSGVKDLGWGDPERLPYSLQIVLENMLRNLDGKAVTVEDIKAVLNWNSRNPEDRDIPFKVSRILMQDFTGVPAIVDLASMRDFAKSVGKDPDLIQPGVPIDLIIDHSVQVDEYNSPKAFEINLTKEIERNEERYRFLKWAGQAFRNLRIFPPSSGICHQINLEYLAKVVMTDGKRAYFDSLVGTDSHTTMINGIGVFGYGVGGIEAEAAMLGEPVYFILPKVVGVKLNGKLQDGVTATDLALTLAKIFREHNVVNKFVEFYGDGVRSLSVPDRATVSNMSPEYGSTISIFPVDEQTLDYLRLTGRPEWLVKLVEEYYKTQGLFGAREREYSEVIEVNLDEIKPSVSGPSLPHQRLDLEKVPESFRQAYLKEQQRTSGDLKDGDIVIAAITSCTNTSNPNVLVMAGLVAKKAYELGLRVDTSKVKTSLAPGSRVVTEYLKRSGLLEFLEKLGFYVVAYGCTTCIGNSGPLPDDLSRLVNEGNLAVVSVLSGNRNYEGRVHNDVRANYLMSPPLVVAYAIAGNINRDLTKEPLGYANGRPVYLKDIWPTNEEVQMVIKSSISRELYEAVYNEGIFKVNPYWNELKAPSGKYFEWDEKSTYIRRAPYFDGWRPGETKELEDIVNARILLLLGDSVSTDHISPAGAIMPDSPAGKYLLSKGVSIAEFNTYGSRRGNHEVMIRGTFANRRLKNMMVNVEGGYTVHYPDGQLMTVYDAAMKYKEEGVPVIVMAGKEYGSGSSRDWAAKGPALLGVRAVVAESFERIHRSNLVGMGIVPLQFKEGESWRSLNIDYSKPVSIIFVEKRPRGKAELIFYDKSGAQRRTELTIRIDSELEMEYIRHGGIMKYVLSKMLSRQ